MSASPAKRRRLNSSEPQPVPNSDAAPNQTPTTPNGASYRSPTKSSLARSHPHLISRTASRSATASRGKVLRDEILGGRKSGSKATIETDKQRPLDLNVKSTNADTDDVDGSNQQDGTKITQLATINHDASQPTESLEPPARQRRTVSGIRQSDNLEPERRLPRMIKPALVRRSSSAINSAPRQESDEPMLPPTPVQLGLSTIPEKPRGLASSSSPRGSKSGSGKRRRRRRPDDPITSSPLKPKAVAQILGAEEAAESDNEPVDEAVESQLDASQNREEMLESRQDEDAADGGNLTAELDEKRSTVRSLRQELRELQADIQRLESAIDAEYIADDVLVSLLSSTTSDRATQGSIDAAPQSGDKAIKHLTLFAPGDLRLETSTTTKQVKGRTKIVHLVVLAAPPPWPAHAFTFSFEVTVDVESIQVEKIEQKPVGARKAPRKARSTGIYKWIWDRLNHELHCLDMSGLVWGLGQWFAASVERAHIFRQIDLQYNDSSEYPHKVGMDLTQADAIQLLPHLDTAQLRVNLPNSGIKPNKQILLSWNIEIDWAGEVKSAVEIAISNGSARSSLGLKDIFASIYPVKGVAMAIEQVSSLIRDDEPTTVDCSAKKRKRRSD